MARRKLLAFLTDPVAGFHEKGEIRARYYNPSNYFDEVHLVSPAPREIDTRIVQAIAGDAALAIHPLGPSYYTKGFLRFGAVAALLKRIRPDVIRAYDPGLRGSLAVCWGARLGIPSVVSVHSDLDDQRRVERTARHRMRTLFERYALPRADAVICVSEHVARYARRHGAARPTVIYNRAYVEQFDVAGAAHKRVASPLTILTVGRFVRAKYQECLIRAVHQLDAKLVLIGNGELRPSLERLVTTLQMADRVTFHSRVPHGEIALQYSAADIFAIATHYEGFCIPVLEAMAAGLPIVASRIPSIEEILGDAGVLVENEPAAFAAALRRLIADPGLRHEYGGRARRRASMMDGSVMEAREAALYETLCASAGARP